MMTKRDYFAFWAPIVSILILLVLINYFVLRAMWFEDGFWVVKIGQTQARVNSIMGTPSKIARCHDSESNRRLYPAGNCFEIYGYFTLFSSYAIAFNKEGKVVQKFHWTFEDGYGKTNDFD